jgi:hypothetical protein
VKYEEINPVLRAFMGNREGFRKLGFSADSLFCLVSGSAKLGVASCFVQLQAQGKTFAVECGPIEIEKGAFEAHYREVCEAINSGRVSQTDMDRIWVESEVCQHKSEFLLALLQRGIVVPKTLN